MRAPSSPRDTRSWQRLIAGCEAAWADDPELAERLHENLPDRVTAATRARRETKRSELLAMARRRLSAFPFEAIHPSWIAELLPKEPLLRGWALTQLDPSLRREVSLYLGPTFFVEEPAPTWFAGWWRRHAEERLEYPRALPGERDENEPLLQLLLLASDEIEMVLELRGLRFVASACYAFAQAYSESRARVPQMVLSFPSPMRERIVILVRDRDFPRTDVWLRRYEVLRGEAVDPVLLPGYLAVLDLAQQYRERPGCFEEGRRLGYRLPREVGQPLLRALDGELGAGVSEETLAEADHETWDARLRRDLRELVSEGLIQPPDPHGGTF